jgi:hypothetical protein
VAIGAGILVVIAPYLLVQHAKTDRWNLTEASGWAIYTRVAPFADCSKFTPPDGTAFLCESTPPSQRPGSDYYAWTGGPARERYGDFKLGNEELRAFSVAAIMAQPLDYATEMLADLSRFLLPVGPRHSPSGGTGPSVLRVDAPTPTPDVVTPVLVSYYDGTSMTTRAQVLDVLAWLQAALRVGTLALSAALLVAAVGAVRLRDERRWILLFIAFTATTLVACVATSNFSWRYAVPVIPFAFIAAALAGSGLSRSRRHDREVGEPPTEAIPDQSRPLVPVP